jgi:hypothetical protein
MSSVRKPDPSDVSDEEWAFVAPSLTLLPSESPAPFLIIVHLSYLSHGQLSPGRHSVLLMAVEEWMP